MQALRFGGGSIALKKHTLNYLMMEQGILYFGQVLSTDYGSTDAVIFPNYLSLVSVLSISAAVLNYVSC